MLTPQLKMYYNGLATTSPGPHMGRGLQMSSGQIATQLTSLGVLIHHLIRFLLISATFVALDLISNL